MKFLVLSAIFFFNGLIGLSQIPEGYYDDAQGLGGDVLKTALYNIIKGHNEYVYTTDTTDVWDILKETDKDPYNPDNVILIYTGWSVDAAQEWNNGDGWEREHVWAKSRGDFGTDLGAGTDVHHLRPIDPSVNSARNNRWFAECDEEYIDNGIPTGSYTSSTEWVWKPRDEVIGDVARMIFYMATRYEGEGGEPDLEVIDYIPADNNTDEPIHALLSDLLIWNALDPVSDYEINRNNIIYSYQNNRNPFIDYPEWVECIWNNNCTGMWFTTVPDTVLTDRDTYSYSVSAFGPDDVLLTLSGEIIPDWLIFRSVTSNFGSATATLEGSTDFNDIGTHAVSIKLSGGTETVFQNFEILVTDGNPIAFTSTPVTDANVDELYAYYITSTGDEGATFTLTGTILPNWLSLSDNIGSTATLSGIPLIEHLGLNTVELTLTDDTKMTITQNFDILVVDPNDLNQIIITQYYEGNSNDKFIEITNIGSSDVDLSSYYLARWGTTDTPSGVYTNGDALTGIIAAGETQVYKNSGATVPAYAVALATASTSATYFNGDDPVALLRYGDTWEDRVDCLYASIAGGTKWGDETGFYRKETVTSGNLEMSILDGSGEWIEVSIEEVNNAVYGTTEYLGFHIGPPVGTEDINTQVKLFPNPVSDILFIETKDRINSIEVMNVTGQLIKKINNFNNTLAVGLSDLQRGLYFMKITDCNGNVSLLKFVKQ
ncbi:MAG: endonuclease [Bacteroidales bacterium]|nr:endonuclease [Bacteroidales bacterium]